MRFRIRFADRIVGASIIFALAVLIVVLAFIGKGQRWFARDPRFRAFFDSATGLAANMDVQYRGFSIGRVKSFRLAANDQVEVIFAIFDSYADRVTEGSLVELQVSPIGLGNRFIFYPGLGTEPLEELAVIPRRGTREAKELAVRGLVPVTEGRDDISLLISRAALVLENLANASALIVEAVNGSERSSLGRIIANVENTTAELPAITGNAADLIAGLDPVIADLRSLSAQLAAPDGTVGRLLDGGGALSQGIDSALASLTGILQSLDRTARFLPPQLPQIAALITEVRGVLHSVEGLLVSLRNNPILKNGFPQEVNSRTGGTGARDIDF
jgi:phospholipid/cholesterol/gamma-HCH transport system substrate-binding protein